MSVLCPAQQRAFHAGIEVFTAADYEFPGQRYLIPTKRGRTGQPVPSQTQARRVAGRPAGHRQDHHRARPGAPFKEQVLPGRRHVHLREGEFYNWIHYIFEAANQTHHFPLLVDRPRLKEDKEAWIHVQLTRVDETSDDRFHPLVEFSGATAIFTFENSD